MDYEKKYKETIAWIDTIMSTLTKEQQEDALEIFPELAEPEDERIRKALISILKSDFEKDTTIYDIRVGDIIAWLEKQDEKKPTLPKWKYKKDNTPLLRDSLILNKYGCVAKSPSGAIVSDVWVLDYDELAKLPKEEIEKQGEQKHIWTDDDRTMTFTLLRDVDQMTYISKEGKNKRIQWLNSLEEKFTRNLKDK